jgi:putative ABC transport system permease protein
LALAVGLVMSLLPALGALRQDPGALLRGAGPRSAAGPQRLTGVLVAAEVAFATLLLVGSGLLIRTFVRLSQAELGFDPERVLMAEVTLPESRYLDRISAQTRVFAEVVERLAASPGVESAAYVITPPLELRGGIGGRLLFREPPPVLPEERPGARGRLVLGDYFGTLRIPIVAGRGFGPDDGADAPPVAIVNQQLANDFWPGGSPLGRQIAWSDWHAGAPVFMTIVGVAADVKGTRLEASDTRAVYAPYAQRQAGWQRWGTVLARTRSDPAAFARTVQQALWAVDPAVPLGRVEALASRRGRLLGPQRFNAVALGLFAAVALFVALQGLAALLSRAVVERRRELGVRMALGARATDVLGLVVTRGLWLTARGLLAGSAAAIAFGHVLAGLLYEVEPHDPATLAAAALLLGLAALVACALPAWRASRLDPMAVLRQP